MEGLKMGEEKVGFVTMAEVRAAAEKIPEVGVGMLGYAFMGKSHSNAYKKMPYIFWPPPAMPKLVAIAGRSEAKVAEAARRFGYSRYYTDWRELLKDKEVQLFDNGGPNNLHLEPCVVAAELGKHILCEKPLAMNAKEAKTMVNAVKKAGVKHMVGFNYRFVPAIRLAKKLIDDDAIGKVYHYHAKYYQEWIMDPAFPRVWRLDRKVAGSGTLGDLGSHIIDLAHFLVGDFSAVTALTRTFIKERPLPEDPAKRGKVDVDDAFEVIAEFANGAIGTLSGSRFCAGRKNYQVVEVYGSKGSIEFNLENLNWLRVHLKDHTPKDLEPSFHDTLVTEGYHPYWENWWPHGHIIGWEHAQVHEVYHIIDAIVKDTSVSPYGATFEDGYRCAVVCDAVLKSADKEKRIQVGY